MRKLLSVFLLLCMASPLFGQASGRIAITSDGNFFDKDDWNSIALSFAVAKDQNRNSDICHVNVCNHFPENNSGWQTKMRNITLNAAGRYGVFCPIYDCRQDKSGAVNHLRGQINQSSASNRLSILLFGPPDIIVQAQQDISNTIRQHCTIYSHSSDYNENYGGQNKLSQCTGFKIVRIINQNHTSRLNDKQNYAEWNFLASFDPTMNNVMRNEVKRADFSDGGLMIYVCTGNQNANSNTVRIMLTQ